jgi:hypothetical protein
VNPGNGTNRDGRRSARITDAGGRG